MDTIRIRGARTHNLKNVNLDLPRHQLIVITLESGQAIEIVTAGDLARAVDENAQNSQVGGGEGRGGHGSKRRFRASRQCSVNVAAR